jgi:hypothetical protein
MTRAMTRPGSSEALHGRRAAPVWLLATADLVIVLLLTLVSDFPVVLVPIILAVVAAFAIVGAVVATRLPRNPIGWMLLATGSVMAVSIVGSTYATASMDQFDGTLPGTVAIAVLAQLTLLPTIAMIGIFVPLLFPDGDLPTRRWRPFAVFSVGAVVMAASLNAVTPGMTLGGTGIVNPLGIDALAGVVDLMGLLEVALVAIPIAVAIISVVVRYRRAGRAQRQQLRLLAWAGSAFLVLVLVGNSNVGPMADVGWVVAVGAMALLPLAIGVAVLRYRLYDFDRIVSRSISYGLVTAVLASVFAGAILSLQGVLAPVTGGNTIAVAASTLVVAALFQPLRRRVQSVVDRRFNRSRYDAERTVAAFAADLRDDVELRDVHEAVRTVVARTVAPASLAIWMREGSGR